MPKYTFICSPEGKLPSGIASTLTNKLKELSGKKCFIELDEAKSKRSLDQNAFLWSQVYNTIRQFHLEQGAAYTLEQVHEACLQDFAPKVELHTLDGKTRLVPMRSKSMNVQEMNQYITNIEVALNQYGVYFPAKPYD